MWTPADRALVGDFGSGRALTDDQFRLLEPLIPPARPGGRPRTTDIRNLLDGLFYLVRTGCQWRHLPPPPAFPPWRTVYGYMRAFLQDGVWESIRHQFVVMLREGAGREASPTAAVIDTQSGASDQPVVSWKLDTGRRRGRFSRLGAGTTLRSGTTSVRIAHEFDLSLRAGEPQTVEKIVALVTSRDVAVSEPMGAHPEVARTVLARYAVGAVELVPV